MPERERAEAEGLIRRREGGGVGKPKCRYMRVSKTAHHPDTKMQGGTSNGREKREIAARIIGALAGVTSGSTRRAGFAYAHTAPYPKFGFTLAEVLITLGIIGIVAAMTMPTLIQKHNKQIVETRLKKFYSTINQAIQLAEVDYGDRTYWYNLSDVDVDKNGNPVKGRNPKEKFV